MTLPPKLRPLVSRLKRTLNTRIGFQGTRATFLKSRVRMYSVTLSAVRPVCRKKARSRLASTSKTASVTAQSPKASTQTRCSNMCSAMPHDSQEPPKAVAVSPWTSHRRKRSREKSAKSSLKLTSRGSLEKTSMRVSTRTRRTTSGGFDDPSPANSNADRRSNLDQKNKSLRPGREGRMAVSFKKLSFFPSQ